MRVTDAERLATWSDSIVARLARPGRLGRAALRAGLPRRVGSIERGMHLLQGSYRLGGDLVERPGIPPWDALPKSRHAAEDAHGFGWLDDLMAVPFPAAEDLARVWTADWITRFGGGGGRGWTAPLAGRRALRWVFHSDALAPVPLSKALGRHTAFLMRRASRTPADLRRVEAVAGLVHAATALDADTRVVADALEILEGSAGSIIGPGGTIASRNPEELATTLALLGWTLEEAVQYGVRPGDALLNDLSHGVATLRAIVHTGGRLPAFHGGGAAPGLADVALALLGHHRASSSAAPPMGYARLRHGGTGVVLDGASPSARARSTGHASTLAFEMADGRFPIVVSCGSGLRYGPRWGHAARATASHSVLALEGYSSSRFGRGGLELSEMPRRVECRRAETSSGTRLAASHDGYVPTHGLVQHRRLELTRDGCRLRGEDGLVADTPTAQRQFDRAREAGPVRFAVRFHLDAEVEPSLDAARHAVWLQLPSSRMWVFRLVEGRARLAVEGSVTFPDDALNPRPTFQIVLFSSAEEYATRLTWELSSGSRAKRSGNGTHDRDPQE